MTFIITTHVQERVLIPPLRTELIFAETTMRHLNLQSLFRKELKKYLPTSEDWENYFLQRYVVYFSFSFPFLLFISYLFVYFLMLIWLLFACLHACSRAKIFIYQLVQDIYFFKNEIRCKYSIIHSSIPWSFLRLFILAFIQWMSDWVRWGTSCNGTSKRMTKSSYVTCSWICVSL